MILFIFVLVLLDRFKKKKKVWERIKTSPWTNAQLEIAHREGLGTAIRFEGRDRGLLELHLFSKHSLNPARERCWRSFMSGIKEDLMPFTPGTATTYF